MSRSSATGCNIGLNRRAATHPAPVPISSTPTEERRIRQRRVRSEAIRGTVRAAVSTLSGFTRIAGIATSLVIAVAGASESEDGSDGCTGAINRYPRRANVSTNRGFSAESPSASRKRLTAAFSPWSKSTNVSTGQSDARSVSRVTSSPGCSSSIAKI